MAQVLNGSQAWTDGSGPLEDCSAHPRLTTLTLNSWCRRCEQEKATLLSSCPPCPWALWCHCQSDGLKHGRGTRTSVSRGDHGDGEKRTAGVDRKPIRDHAHTTYAKKTKHESGLVRSGPDGPEIKLNSSDSSCHIHFLHSICL